MSGLVTLVTEKVSHDLPEVMYDEHIFSHLVDEAILFDKDLRSSFGYPSSLPGCLTVLTGSDAFHKWNIVEKQCKYMTYSGASLIRTSLIWNIHLSRHMLQN